MFLRLFPDSRPDLWLNIAVPGLVFLVSGK